MRVSIWQQFSSNHSANFDLVGFFTRADRARESAGWLQDMLKEIAAARNQVEGGNPYEPTDVELRYSQQFQVDWENRSIDWIIMNGDQVRNIATFGEYVFVSNIRHDRSWRDADVIKPILEKYGATVCVTGSFHLGDFTAMITCKPGDRVDSSTLLEILNGHLQHTSRLIPWINFWNGRPVQIDSSPQRDLTELQVLFETSEPTLSERDRLTIQDAQNELEVYGKAFLEDGLLKIDLQFVPVLEQTVPTLIKYLESMGCTDIGCEVHYVMK